MKVEKMKLKIAITLGVCFFIAVIWFTRDEKDLNSEEVERQAEGAKAFPVEATNGVFENVEHTLEAVGSFFPEDEVTVGAEENGVIKKLHVDEGYKVKKGDLLLEIDDEKLRMEVEESRAMLKEARTRLEHSRSTLKRMTRLFEEGVIGQQEFDDASNQASLNQAVVENIRARLRRFKKSLRETKVVAPMDGVVSEKMVSAGEYVKVGADLVKIVDANPLKLTFTLPEKNAGEIRTGQKVKVTSRVYPNEKFEGEIYFINPKVDPDTRTIEVKAWVDNSEYRLRPGYFVNVRVLLGERRSLVLPESAVVVREGKIVVMAIMDGRIVYKRVTPGVRYNGKVEILEGISPEDDIVVSGRSEITEGTRVEIISSRS
jgi:membrane fusion protein (multidrug efflux system)